VAGFSSSAQGLPRKNGYSQRLQKKKKVCITFVRIGAMFLLEQMDGEATEFNEWES
jgi:hypothetical protein